MTNEEFDAHVKSFFTFIDSIGRTKGKEYSGAVDGKDDRLANFRRLSVKLGVKPETICLIYGTKHLDAIDTFVKTLQRTGEIPTTLSEPIEGRFHDAVLYLILLAALVAERKATAAAKHEAFMSGLPGAAGGLERATAEEARRLTVEFPIT